MTPGVVKCRMISVLGKVGILSEPSLGGGEDGRLRPNPNFY